MNSDRAENTQAGPNRPWLLGLCSTLLLGLLGAGIAYYGIQPPDVSTSAPALKKDNLALNAMITRIEMPHDDLPIPPGPHREEFRVACTTCHSPRLVFTQPGFAPKKWSEVVHKMVAVYGAPLSVEQEKHLVDYLATVHGK